MELEQTLRQRYSTRKFLPQPVAHETLCRILEWAQCTPSWCNTQPWQLIITAGEETARFRDALVEHVAAGAPPAPDYPFPAAYEGVYRERRLICGLQLYKAVGVPKGDKEASQRQALENYRLFNAPHVAILTTEEKLGFYGGVDCGLYIQSFMLAARDHGIDCIAQAALASHAPFVRQHLGIPEHRRIICGIAFGYADPGHPINHYRTERSAIGTAAEFRGWD